MITTKAIVNVILAAAFLLIGAAVFGQAAGLPPGEADAKSRLLSSPRHGEWAVVDVGGGDRLDAWVVYPERSDPAPVVLVIHEIFGLSDWVRAVADQLAAEGFIAVAPDLISGKGPGGKGTSSVDADEARRLIGQLDPAEVVRRLDVTARYATSLPAAAPRIAVVGFCWGGGISFSYATQNPNLSAAVVYYGTSPDAGALSRVRAPILGLYGGSDNRVDATVPPAAAELKRLGKSFDYVMYEGAGHAFLRAQDGQSGANMKATQQAWPRMVQFLKESFGNAPVSEMFGGAKVLPAGFTIPECVCEDEGNAAETVQASSIRLAGGHP